MSNSSLSGMNLRVLAEKSKYAKTCHRQKNRSYDFEPQLVPDSAERAQGRANRPSGRAEGAIASGLLAGDSRHHANFLPGGNFAHALDFNSLWRYNDAATA
jgi:hypothetical protein